MSVLQEKAIAMLGSAVTVTCSVTTAGTVYTVSATKTLVPVLTVVDNFSAAATDAALDFGSSTGSWRLNQSATTITATTQSLVIQNSTTQAQPVFVGATVFTVMGSATSADTCTCRVRLFGFEV